MLFNSLIFLICFLPIVFAGFFWLGGRERRSGAVLWLVAASLVFYGAWSIGYLGLLIASIALNYTVGTAMARRQGKGVRRPLLVLGLTVNLGLLAYFKYIDFLAGSIAALAGLGWPALNLVLPLGISFYTFTQIAFLVDVYRDEAREYNPFHYALFVAYFPHLVAGPILHHKEMMPQFARPDIFRISHENVAVGLSIFFIGLFKKVVLADGIAPYANLGFAAAAGGASFGLIEGWSCALAYTLQLYFDFSGYSDMAVGISRLFGIQLPVNFHSPYKATSVIEFWRRWHMTLSRFLREYLYIPLGGGRRGSARRYLNLMVTMLLGGLWHGAGWTFVLWGGLHGFFLVINHAWRAVIGRFGMASSMDRAPVRVVSVLVTFVAVVAAWVVFRADNLNSAVAILRGMSGANGVPMPDHWFRNMGALGAWASDYGVRGGGFGGPFGGLPQAAWIGFLLAIVWLMPNTQQIMSRHAPGLGLIMEPDRHPAILNWEPSLRWALFIAAIGFWSIINLSRPSTFLYWQF